MAAPTPQTAPPRRKKRRHKIHKRRVGSIGAGGATHRQVVRGEPFDVVFTDLAMPGLSGWQVARGVKSLAPTVPVFLVTGFGVELSAEEQRAHGVDLVLSKPLNIQSILAAAASATPRAGRLTSNRGAPQQGTPTTPGAPHGL